MFSVFSKFKKGFQKTTKSFFSSIGGLFSIKTLDESSIEAIEEALYTADFGVETTSEIMEAIQTAYKKEKHLRGQEAAQLAATVLKRILQGAEAHYAKPKNEDLEVICLLGINGVGKTTTAGKLAYKLKNQGYSVLLGACDTFRAAANEQINLWAHKIGINIVSSQHGADAASVAFDAYQSAKSRSHDVLVLDTAGRLHTKYHLMDELTKIKRVLQKNDPQAPQHAWLVVDGSMGANSIQQARAFNEKFGITGLIVTKLDGTSRGGALVGIYRELKIPIYYVGLGEQPEDLQDFSVENYINALFDISIQA